MNIKLVLLVAVRAVDCRSRVGPICFVLDFDCDQSLRRDAIVVVGRRKQKFLIHTSAGFG